MPTRRTWRLTTATGEEHTFDIVVSAVGLFTQPVMPDLVEEEPFTGTSCTPRAGTTRWICADSRVAVLGTGFDCGATGSRGRQGGGQGVLGAALADLGAAETGPRPTPTREKWVFAHVPLAKKIYRTRLWLRSESNISVIENGSDKTQEFKGIALRVLEATVPDEELRDQADSAPSVRLQTAGVRHRLPADADPAARRGGVQPGPRAAVAVAGHRGRHRTRRRRRGVRDGVRRRRLPRPDRRRRRATATSLRDTWRDGAFAYLGMAVPGYPNFFMLYGPNTNVGSNSVIFMLEAQAHYIVRALKHMRRKRQVLHRGAAGRDGRLHRQDRHVDAGHGLADPVQQLLSRRQRPGGDPVAAQRPRLLGADPAVQAR